MTGHKTTPAADLQVLSGSPQHTSLPTTTREILFVVLAYTAKDGREMKEEAGVAVPLHLMSDISD